MSKMKNRSSAASNQNSGEKATTAWSKDSRIGTITAT